MPSYTFQARFVPFVQAFTKRGTIRKIRKYPAKPGDMIYHFTGPRFKPVRIIDKQVCTRVDTIFILDSGRMFIAENAVFEQQLADELFLFLKDPNIILHECDGYKIAELTPRQADALAWADGFRFDSKPEMDFDCSRLMLDWFRQVHTLPFAGHHIQW